MTSQTPSITTYSLKISSRGQVVLPAPVRHQLNLKPGDELQLTTDRDGKMVLKRKPTALDWADLIKGMPHEDVQIDSAGHYDEKASPHFDAWMKGDEPD